MKRILFSIVAICLVLVSCKKEPDNIPDPRKVVTLTAGNRTMPSAGTVFTDFDDSPEKNKLEKLVDNNRISVFKTPRTAIDIVFQANKPFALQTYKIVSSMGDSKNDPAKWEFYASADGETWNLIDSQSGETFSGRNLEQAYDVRCETAFSYYKISILANNGGTSLDIAEISLSDEDPDNIDHLIARAKDFTKVDNTPMGLSFKSLKYLATQDQLNWLADPSKNPDFSVLNYPDVVYTWKEPQKFEMYPYENPIPADCNQSSIGDCCLIAFMATLSYSAPDYIKNIIKEVPGGYEVTMYDPKGKAIVVGVSKEFVHQGTTLPACKSKNNVACWSTVMEKATMKYLQIFPYCKYLRGIPTDIAAAIFTGDGEGFWFYPNTGISGKEQKKIVTVLLKKGYGVVGGFQKQDVQVDDVTKSLPSHAYSFFPAQKQDALFSMRNPWGSCYGGNGAGADRDGMMNVYDDGRVPPILDIRIVSLGAAREYLVKHFAPYYPPQYTTKAVEDYSEYETGYDNIFVD
jgi:hypothetical protein